ncbi:hypothetical protein E2C01_052084 [Portunus trituberculatus]|uniref:Uncharacterized protein n=1 Tax=Portunus trituberculatus TaxID=210409 RepID=A0A5B7GKN2_PORTR|nr:hypothetical protein [Portunus trituberculatus]
MGRGQQGGAALAIQSAYTVIFPPARICRPVTVQIDFFILLGSAALHFFSPRFVTLRFSVGQWRPRLQLPSARPPPSPTPSPIGELQEKNFEKSFRSLGIDTVEKKVNEKQRRWLGRARGLEGGTMGGRRAGRRQISMQHSQPAGLAGLSLPGRLATNSPLKKP